MSKQKNFNELKNKHMKTLSQYVPIVARVHGDHHPEFWEVKRVFDKLANKIDASKGEKPNLSQEFMELKKITNSYTVPSDVCESYEAVYKMLEELDKAYEA